MLGFKLVVVVIFVCTFLWVIRVAGNTVSTPPVEEVKLIPSDATKPGSQPEVGF